MFSGVLARRAALVLVVCFVALGGCGDKKKKKGPGDDGVSAQDQPPPDKKRSFLARACEEHSEATRKANCLCRVDVIDATLSKELLAKLETVPEGGPTEAVIEHLGGATHLSRVYEAMRKASAECEKGAAR